MSGGGGCGGTDSTAPLTCDVPLDSEPTCKASLVPAVGTNGIACQSVASSYGSKDALGQEVTAEPVAGTSGDRRVTKPRPPVCNVQQEMYIVERGQSVATNCVQRVAAGVPRVVTAGPHAGVAASTRRSMQHTFDLAWGVQCVVPH